MSTAVHDQDRLNGSLFPNQHPPFESVSSLLPTQLATIRSPAGRSSFTTDLHATPKVQLSIKQIAAFVGLSPSFLPAKSPQRPRRMSKSSTVSTPKPSSQLPSKSAWAKGPPSNTSTAPSTRPQSPATQSPAQTHSRRSSQLGNVKDAANLGFAKNNAPPKNGA